MSYQSFLNKHLLSSEIHIHIRSSRNSKIVPRRHLKKCTKLLPLFKIESDHTVHSYVICFLILNLSIFHDTKQCCDEQLNKYLDCQRVCLYSRFWQLQPNCPSDKLCPFTTVSDCAFPCLAHQVAIVTPLNLCQYDRTPKSTLARIYRLIL